MDPTLFSDAVTGFVGNTCYSLKYIAHTRNLRYTWPHNNIFARSQNEESMVKSILRQPVGIDRCYDYKDELYNLKPILKQFLAKHRKTNYEVFLRKCYKKPKLKSLQPTPNYIVKEYVHRLIHTVIPLGVFGCKNERRVFEKNIKKILHFGKGQVFSLNMLMNRVRTKNKIYLKTLNDHVNKTNLLAKLYVWLLKCFIFPALKCVFYVTDSNQSKKYLFYEKSIWQSIQQRTFNQVKRQIVDTYKNCLITRMVKSKNLFIVRILPKRRGGRPIYMRWKRRLPEPRNKLPLSEIVKHFFSQMADEYFVYVRNIQPETFHVHLVSFYFKWSTLSKPPIYFVKVDFTDAFGSILHDKLMDSINALANKDRDKEIVFTYRNQLKRGSVQSAVNIIENYVRNFMYKNNKNVYKLTTGISQGGSLSSLLCNFYLGELDLKYLSEYGSDPQGFLVRTCDDYLYLTLDHEKAKSFLQLLQKGFPDYNLKVNDAKTETNVYDESVKTVRISSFELDVKTFQLHRSYFSFKNSSIFHHSTFRTMSHPGQIIAKRMSLLCTQKSNKLFFDSLYNTAHTILMNVYELASLSAARFFSYINVLFLHHNQMFILQCIRSTVIRIALNVLTKIAFCCAISNSVLQWIGMKAFLIRLRRHRNNRDRCGEVIKQIRYFLTNLRSKFNERELKMLDELCANSRIYSLRSIF